MNQENSMPSSMPSQNSTPNPVEPLKKLESPKGFSMGGFKFSKNAALIGAVIIGLLIVAVLMMSGSSFAVPSFLLGSSASNKTTAEKAINFINNGDFLPAGQVASLGDISVESGIIKFQVKIGSNVFDSYVTKDGKLFFTEPPLDISAYDNSGTNVGGNNVPDARVKVSVDDDAVLGNKDAPITIIEFSDYECPFCKRHFEQTYPQIKKDYIDTGKVKLVFRDFVAVQGHNPLAMSQALGAECAREQGGDAVYFKYHDEIFKKTTSNGNGMPVAQLAVIAGNLGLNVSSFKSCLDSQKYKEEFNNDNADALSALPKGDAGTPSFFIGKSSADGMIDGALVKGAQPYSVFQATIEELLK